MTGYQKLKAQYEIAYKALWQMATSSPKDWMMHHEEARKAIEAIEKIRNGKTK